MQRDMQELREGATASAKTAQSEKELSLQLEKDLKAVCAELAEVKEEAAKNTSGKTGCSTGSRETIVPVGQPVLINRY